MMGVDCIFDIANVVVTRTWSEANVAIAVCLTMPSFLLEIIRSIILPDMGSFFNVLGKVILCEDIQELSYSAIIVFLSMDA